MLHCLESLAESSLETTLRRRSLAACKDTSKLRFQSWELPLFLALDERIGH